MANAHNQTVGRMSPRQKMINLMYIVLTAMLALNVSSDVLNGFSLVEGGLVRTNENVSDRNTALYLKLEDFTKKNPQKSLKFPEALQMPAKESSSVPDKLYFDALSQNND